MPPETTWHHQQTSCDVIAGDRIQPGVSNHVSVLTEPLMAMPREVGQAETARSPAS